MLLIIIKIKMKFSLYLHILVLATYCSISKGLIQIELKKSVAKFHNQYLKTLKFIQVYSKNEFFTSFLEDKEVPLHQQVYIKINFQISTKKISYVLWRY